MRRSLGPAALGSASRATSLCAAATLVWLTTFAPSARAQTATAPPPTTATTTTTPPTVVAPPMTSPSPTPATGLEAGDTAPPGAPPPVVEPLGAPVVGAAAVPVAPMTLTRANGPYAPVAPAPRPRPFYQRAWFWGAVGVAIVTLAIIGVVSLQPKDPSTPPTALGDMRAF